MLPKTFTCLSERQYLLYSNVSQNDPTNALKLIYDNLHKFVSIAFYFLKRTKKEVQECTKKFVHIKMCFSASIRKLLYNNSVVNRLT